MYLDNRDWARGLSFTGRSAIRHLLVVTPGTQNQNEWADFFLEHYSKPPIRAAKTHKANQAALKTLRPVFGPMKITEIEFHLRSRLHQRRRVRRKGGVVELGTLKPTTVH